MKKCVYMKKRHNRKFTFVDLFAGCGGLSEGFYRSGFEALAHVEINKFACETLRARMRHYGYKRPEEEVVEHDITAPDIIQCIDRAVAGREVDVIIGGPPCQAYSTAGRARDPDGMKKDPRNFLFENYVRILNHYKPKFFVFENVTGILTASINGRSIIKQVFGALGKYYNLVDSLDCVVLNSVNYGVPQQRKRVIIFGVRKDIDVPIQDLYDGVVKTHYGPEDDSVMQAKLKKYVSVRDAIAEFPPLHQGEGKKSVPFRYSFGNDFLMRIGSESLHELHDHVCRKHNAMDVVRYSEMSRHHWTFTQLLENRPDLHHERARLFGNSYVVQFWDEPARTIIAHLVKDGNQFIHPDPNQGRTLTVREAARLQSFPDDFEFAGSRGDQFRQIGNAVPPLFAEALAQSLKKALKRVSE